MRLPLCALAAWLTLNAADAANIIYFRDAAFPNDGLAQALNFSGHLFVTAATAEEFAASVASGSYDLAVFAVQQREAAQFSAAIDVLGPWLAGGGRALGLDWSGNAALAAHFQAAPLDATNFPRVTLTNATLATGATANPFPLRHTGWFRQAWALAPLAGGTSAAHFENGASAIVLGHAGRSLLYGYAPDAPRSFATFANGLALLFGTPAPPPPLGAPSTPLLATTTATFSAVIRTGSTPLTAFFEYGPSRHFGRTTPAQSFAPGENGASLSANVTSLAPHSVYFLRVRAQNAIGTLVSGDALFVTGNTLPVAANRTARLGPDGTVTLDLFARASDLDLDALSLANVGGAGAGSVALHGDGTATYTAAASFGASDTFHYTIRDGFGGSATATVSILAALGADTDGDGAPDAWESAHGLDPANAADAPQDRDGDGASNLAEFLANTDPRLAGSRFTIASIARDALGRGVVTFTAQPGRAYAVLAADEVAGAPWTSIADFPASSATQTRSATDAAASGLAARFYLVKTPAEP